MELDLQWLLLGLPVAFALGWIGSRLDLRQWKREQHDSPRAYFKGLNLLLNEQQDKAIDAFVEAVQQDPDTSDLHFALGNLFRRRGEYERAVRVHQHLLARADLSETERDRAQHALAQDFIKAGLFDRAEAAYRALEGTAFATEARLALLSLYERSREWRSAADVAAKLEQAGTGSFSERIAHHWCEIAADVQATDPAAADAALQTARRAAPRAPRPQILAAARLAQQGRMAEACAAYIDLLSKSPEVAALIAADCAAAASAGGTPAEARAALEAAYRAGGSFDVLRAWATLEAAPAVRSARMAEHLRAQPTLSAALAVLPAAPVTATLSDSDATAVRGALERAVRPLQRYRCAACGFEAQRYFWQCPGCLSWDSYPMRRVEEL